tara:strand:+ start:722 stop:1189 length:468 start_codon:yes stop_codon:yes gene_type:complete
MDICDIVYANPNITLTNVYTETQLTFADVLELKNVPETLLYVDPKLSITDFDSAMQDNWFLPKDYKKFNIVQYILDLCTTEAALQRTGEELLLYQERNLFPLLVYLKYLVDTMRANNILWGVGRGSSVASYVLFLLGVHRIDSLYYDLDIKEFLK